MGESFWPVKARIPAPFSLALLMAARMFLLVPLVDRQVEDSRTLIELGEVEVLLLRDALTGSLSTKLEVQDATLAEARAANKLKQMLEPRWFTPSQHDAKEAE